MHGIYTVGHEMKIKNLHHFSPQSPSVVHLGHRHIVALDETYHALLQTSAFQTRDHQDFTRVHVRFTTIAPCSSRVNPFCRARTGKSWPTLWKDCDQCCRTVFWCSSLSKAQPSKYVDWLASKLRKDTKRQLLLPEPSCCVTAAPSPCNTRGIHLLWYPAILHCDITLWKRSFSQGDVAMQDGHHIATKTLISLSGHVWCILETTLCPRSIATCSQAKTSELASSPCRPKKTLKIVFAKGSSALIPGR